MCNYNNNNNNPCQENDGGENCRKQFKDFHSHACSCFFFFVQAERKSTGENEKADPFQIGTKIILQMETWSLIDLISS